MKKIFKILLTLLVVVVVFTRCGKSENNQEKEQVIKIGINGDDNIIWKSVKERLAKEGIKLEIISFSDYIRPNLALQEGEIDANAFQTVIYFEKFKGDHNLQIENVAYTVLTPMGIYSKKIKDLSTLKEGAKVGIPNDASNGGRALLLLQDAGLIKLKEESSTGLETIKDIIENPKKIEIIQLVANQLPRSIDDLDIAVINNNVAVEAGYRPAQDAIFLENPAQERMKKYFNIIAVRGDRKDDEKIKKLVSVYNTDETREKIKEYYKGSGIPAF